MTRTISKSVGGLLLLACAGATPPPEAPRAPTTAQWDAAAAAELEAASDKMEALFKSMDVDAIKAQFAADGFVVSYDLDMAGKPVRLATHEELMSFIELTVAEMKKMGGGGGMTVRFRQCRATAATGTCVVEMDIPVPLPDGSSKTVTLWGTSAARRGEDGWKWTHWHASYAQLPEPPPPPAPPAPPALPISNVGVKDLRWQESPGGGGSQVALLWQSPATRESVSVVKLPRKYDGGRHIHTAASHAYVTDGAMTITYADGTRYEVKKGGYHYTPAQAVHTVTSAKGCTFLARTDGPFDQVAVDEQGKPVSPK